MLLISLKSLLGVKGHKCNYYSFHLPYLDLAFAVKMNCQLKK